MSTFLGVTTPLPAGSTATPLFCEHCGATVKLVTPVALTDLVVLTRAFEDAHAECLLDKKEREGR